MNKKIILFALSFMFLIPFSIQANTINTPSYQVDVLHSAIDIGSDKVAASSAVKAVDSVQPVSQIKSADMNIKMTLSKSKPEIILIGQCGVCHSTATGVNGVSGGNSIGISKPG